MKIKAIFLLVTATLLMVLAACQEETEPPTASIPPSEATAPVTPDAAPSELPSETPGKEDSGLAEYQTALRQIISEHIYPDGRDTGSYREWSIWTRRIIRRNTM